LLLDLFYVAPKGATYKAFQPVGIEAVTQTLRPCPDVKPPSTTLWSRVSAVATTLEEEERRAVG